jgi:transcriptional regulator with GAF, ATPase, and Fis domain
MSSTYNSINGFATNSPVRLAGNANRSELLDCKVSYLKILALSLLREIASVEKTGESRATDSIDMHAEVRRFETELIRSALLLTGGRQRLAARLLGTKVTTLNTKIKRYKIQIVDEPPATTQIIHVAE